MAGSGQGSYLMPGRGRRCHDGAEMTPPRAAPAATPGPAASTAGFNVDAPRKASRATEGGLLGGVAAGMAQHSGLPVLWVRVGFLVLVAFGGFGAVLYAALWLGPAGAPHLLRG